MPYLSVVDVHLILERADGHVLLAERAGTGYADGLLNVPGGKLEDGEDVRTAAIREAREELGVVVDPGDTRYVCVVHHRNPGEEARVGFFFATSVWAGEPVNAEPDKCAGLLWADPDDLPGHTIAYSAAGVRAYREGSAFVLHGWDPAAGGSLSIADGVDSW
jgi:8-oxo-dGTP pyrophosphatase MutT (NUDIX family)